MNTRTIHAGLGLVALLALTGCGGDEAADASPEPAESAPAETTEATEESETPEPEVEENEYGTREDPLAVGTTVSTNTWEATLNDVQLDQTDAVMADNEFNPAPPEGFSYALVDATFTYLGDGSVYVLNETGISYITESGEGLLWSDTSSTSPDQMNIDQELFEGGTVEGTLAIAVPEGDEGSVRLLLGEQEAWYGVE